MCGAGPCGAVGCCSRLEAAAPAGGSSPVNHETGSFNLHSFALQDVFSVAVLSRCVCAQSALCWMNWAQSEVCVCVYVCVFTSVL